MSTGQKNATTGAISWEVLEIIIVLCSQDSIGQGAGNVNQQCLLKADHYWFMKLDNLFDILLFGWIVKTPDILGEETIIRVGFCHKS
jgi:hypothetical protein